MFVWKIQYQKFCGAETIDPCFVISNISPIETYMADAVHICENVGFFHCFKPPVNVISVFNLFQHVINVYSCHTGMKLNVMSLSLVVKFKM